MSKKLKLFIVISLILNIIMIGIIVGYSYKHFGVNRGNKIITLLDRSALSEERRNDLKKRLQEILPNKEERRKNKQQWRNETLAILTAKNLDIKAYRAQLEKRIYSHHQKKKRRVDIMVEIASQLNQDERKDLAEIFRSTRKRKKGL